MFRSYMYSDTSDYFLRDYVAIAMAILKLLKTFSRVKISSLRAKAQW